MLMPYNFVKTLSEVRYRHAYMVCVTRSAERKKDYKAAALVRVHITAKWIVTDAPFSNNKRSCPDCTWKRVSNLKSVDVTVFKLLAFYAKKWGSRETSHAAFSKNVYTARVGNCWLYLHDAGRILLRMHRNGDYRVFPTILTTALYSATPIFYRNGKFRWSECILATSGHFSLRMRRNAVISISGPKSVVSIVLNDIVFLYRNFDNLTMF